jgi:glyoxylase-like metal-dependent hydrolase (beta-lactamase superfamily II)
MSLTCVQPKEECRMKPTFNPTRRSFVFAGAAGASLTILPAMIPAAFGKAPLAGSQAISVHRMKVGEFEVTAMLDGYIDVQPTVLQADQELVKTLLTQGGWPAAPMRLPVNTFLVNTGDKLVLLDAGGAKLIGPGAGRLPQCLAAAGITPDQIDEVYITHCHGDHLHGTVTPEGGRMFPNAILRIAKDDLDYWGSAAEEAKAPENQRGRWMPAKRAIAAYGDRIKPFTLGEELTRGIRSVEASGHTPGHSCYMVQSGSARLLAIGDTMHVAPVQFPRPEITVAFDWDQAKARAKRMSIFEMAVKEGIPIAAVHLPFPGIGRLRKNGDAFVFDPAPWQLF